MTRAFVAGPVPLASRGLIGHVPVKLGSPFGDLVDPAHAGAIEHTEDGGVANFTGMALIRPASVPIPSVLRALTRNW